MPLNRFLIACGGREPIRLAIDGDVAEFDRPFIRIDALDQCIWLLMKGHLFQLALTAATASDWFPANVDVNVGSHAIRWMTDPGTTTPNDHPFDRDDRVPTVRFEVVGKFRSKKPLDVSAKLLLIGRDEPAKFKIAHESIAPVQALVVRTAVGPWLVDLADTGTTLVNDAAIRTTPLRDGDRLQLGAVELIVRTSTATAAVQPAAPPVDAALGPILNQVAQFQQQTFEQFREMLGSMTEMFGAVLNEHRQFVREEFARLDRGATATPPVAAAPAPPQIAVPPPKVYAPPVPPETVEQIHAPAPGASAPPANMGMHLWVQEQIGSLEKTEQSRWQRLLEKFRGY